MNLLWVCVQAPEADVESQEESQEEFVEESSGGEDSGDPDYNPRRTAGEGSD